MNATQEMRGVGKLGTWPLNWSIIRFSPWFFALHAVLQVFFLGSRVVPGCSCTTARRSPIRRLKRVDLPTLGRPTSATIGMTSGASRPS